MSPPPPASPRSPFFLPTASPAWFSGGLFLAREGSLRCDRKPGEDWESTRETTTCRAWAIRVPFETPACCPSSACRLRERPRFLARKRASRCARLARGSAPKSTAAFKLQGTPFFEKVETKNLEGYRAKPALPALNKLGQARPGSKFRISGPNDLPGQSP